MFKNILFAIWVIGTILLAVYGQYLAAAFSVVIGLQVFILAFVVLAFMAATIAAAGVVKGGKLNVTINNKEITDEP